MVQLEQQGYEPLFQLDNKYVVKGWEKINPKNQKPSVSIEKVEMFIKYVFVKSKDELEIDLEEDTDYMQMILDFLQEHEINDKKTFTLEEALEILNWAVDSGDEEEQEGQEGQEQKEQQAEKQEQAKPQPKKQSKKSLGRQKKPQEPEKPQQHEEKQQKHDEEPKQVTQAEKIQGEKIQEPKQQKKQSAQQQTYQSKHQQHPESVRQKNEPEQMHEHKEPFYQEPQHKEHQKPHHEKPNRLQDQYDWGNDESYEQKSKKLYKEINSYQEKSPNDNSSFSNIFVNQMSFNDGQQVHQDNQNPPPTQTSKKYYKQPLSIKKSLAQLKKSKVQPKSKDLPVLKLGPAAKEMRYLKKQKIVLKNKKPKRMYHPELTGLQELFKFYCGLNSEFYSISKHKDPAKGTFDEFQSRMTNLYMHNFMLLCKDFSISESKISGKAGKKNMPNDRIKENMVETKGTDPKNKMAIERISSKGLVPGSIQISAKMNKSGVQVEIDQKQKQQPKGKKEKVEAKKQIWERDRLSNYFKRQADYKLNVMYDKFIQIMKTVLKDKLIIQKEKPQQQVKPQPVAQKQSPTKQVQAKRKPSYSDEKENEASQAQISEAEKSQQHDKEEPLQEQQPKEQKQPIQNEEQKSQPLQIDPVIMAICRFFKIDTQENYESTIAKLHAQYKINSPLPAPKTQQPKKPVLQMQHSLFQQDVNDVLKARQLQKQQQRIQIKEKYLNKYSVPQVDVYSSFKGATNQVNSLNSLYGSAPKLIPNKQGKCSTVSEGTFGANTIDYDMRKKHSGQYKINMASIIKDARNEIMNTGKENKQQSNRVKQHLNTQILGKSRLNGLNSSQNSPKPTLGYKKLHDLRQLRQQEETLSSILLNNSLLTDGGNTSRSQKIKLKSKDINSPLLQRMGCHEEDDLLNKYFDQEKNLEKSNVKLAVHFR